jgi:ketosteroid isomerase-like protein
MKSLSLISVFAALLAPINLTNAQENTEDEQAFRKVMSGFVDEINRHDSVAFGKLLAEDAEFVVITGECLKGRNQIEK